MRVRTEAADLVAGTAIYLAVATVGALLGHTLFGLRHALTFGFGLLGIALLVAPLINFLRFS